MRKRLSPFRRDFRVRQWVPGQDAVPSPVTLNPMPCPSIAAVIPARLASTRLSRKVLRELAGRPMIEWVWRAAASSGLMDPVLVATDAEEVAAVCRLRG